MTTTTTLFDDFQPISKAQWLAQIEKDLKGKSFDDLQWQMSAAISVAPFYTKEEQDFDNEPFIYDNDWHICESIEPEKEDYKAANKIALEALMGGADALDILISNNTSAAEMETLLEGVELSYIQTHFFFVGKKTNLAQKKLKNFYEIAKKRGDDTNVLAGSLHIAPLGNTPNWENTAALLRWVNEFLPAFKVLTVNGRGFYIATENVADGIGADDCSCESVFIGVAIAGFFADRYSSSFTISNRHQHLLFCKYCQNQGVEDIIP
jgi:methylmalonyl-CoA mutase